MRPLLRWAHALPAMLACILFFPRASSAASVPFTAENRVLLSSASVQAVVTIAGGYRMYVASSSFSILSASSTDQAAWGLETGVRLSTTANAPDASSITACGILPSTNPASGLRMFYVGISSAGLYSILSATSTNGLTWGKEVGIRLRRNNGLAFLDSPRPISINNGLMRLFYVADSTGGNTAANYRIFSASSTDGGLTFTDEGQVLSDQAYQVSVTTLTNGMTRLYYSAALSGQTTASLVLSAISSNGLSFAKESGPRLSTNSATAALTYPVVVRSTESFRWRMFSNYTLTGTTAPFVSSALTLTPVPATLSPATVLTNQGSVPFTVTGEIFSPSPSVSFGQGSATIATSGVSRSDDMDITGLFTPLGQSTGKWDLIVTNSNGASGTLTGGLFIDVPPGIVSVLDNLFRPLRGDSAKISVTVFQPGTLSLRLYTVAGGLVSTLFNQSVPMGTTTVTWNGTTSAGNVVASGVYLLKTTGPKVNRIDKIVVIK